MERAVCRSQGTHTFNTFQVNCVNSGSMLDIWIVAACRFIHSSTLSSTAIRNSEFGYEQTACDVVSGIQSIHTLLRRATSQLWFWNEKNSKNLLQWNALECAANRLSYLILHQIECAKSSALPLVTDNTTSYISSLLHCPLPAPVFRDVWKELIFVAQNGMTSAHHRRRRHHHQKP